MPVPAGDAAPMTAPVMASTPVLGSVAVYVTLFFGSTWQTGALPAAARETRVAAAAKLEMDRMLKRATVESVYSKMRPESDAVE